MVDENKDVVEVDSNDLDSHDNIENVSSESAIEQKPVEKKGHGKLIVAGVVIIALAVAAFFFFNSGNPTGNVILDEEAALGVDGIVARVNDVDITAEELNEAYNTLPPQYQFSMTKEDLLERLVDYELIYQKSEEAGLLATREEAQAQFDKTKSEYPLGEEAFMNEMEIQGVSEEMFVEQYQRQLSIQNYLESEFLNNIEVTEDEMMKYYEDNPEMFEVGESVVARHILIGDAEMETVDQEAKANEVLAELTEENFCDNVKEYTTDVASAETCGEYAFRRGDALVEEFKALAFDQEVGAMGTVNTAFGTHIIWTVEKIDARTVEYDEAKIEIEQFLKNERYQTEYDSFIEEISEGSDVEVLI